MPGCLIVVLLLRYGDADTQSIPFHEPYFIKMLVEELGANPNVPDGLGNTALHIAVTPVKRLPLVKYLVLKGANVHAKNKLGETPLLLAARLRLWSIAQYLIAVGGSITDKATNSLVSVHKYMQVNVQGRKAMADGLAERSIRLKLLTEAQHGDRTAAQPANTMDDQDDDMENEEAPELPPGPPVAGGRPASSASPLSSSSPAAAAVSPASASGSQAASSTSSASASTAAPVISASILAAAAAAAAKTAATANSALSGHNRSASQGGTVSSAALQGSMNSASSAGTAAPPSKPMASVSGSTVEDDDEALHGTAVGTMSAAIKSHISPGATLRSLAAPTNSRPAASMPDLGMYDAKVAAEGKLALFV